MDRCSPDYYFDAVACDKAGNGNLHFPTSKVVVVVVDVVVVIAVTVAAAAVAAAVEDLSDLMAFHIRIDLLGVVAAQYSAEHYCCYYYYDYYYYSSRG